MKSYDAIVVGAGFAGAVAARELRAVGLETLVVDARDRVGGRACYRRFAGTEACIEVGATYVTAGQQNVDREMHRYGFQRKRLSGPDRRIWRLGGTRRTSGFPVPLGEGLEAERVLSMIRAAAARVRPGVPHDQQAIVDLDVSVEEFIERLQAPPVTRDLISVWAARFTGMDLTAASALWHLHAIAKSNGLFPLASSFQIESGSSNLVSAILDDEAPDVRLSTPVVKIEQDDTAVAVFTADGEALVASRAVIALPVNVLADVEFSPELNEGKRMLARERHAGQVVKVFALVENLPERVMAVSWEVDNMFWFSTEEILPEGNLLVGFGLPSAHFDPTSVADVQAALDAHLEGARVVLVDGHDWNADPYSRGAWMVPRPGQLTKLMSAQSVAEHRLHFAGGDISTGWMSYMDGSLESGRRAADELKVALAMDAGSASPR